jgi:hypothetical protein
VSVGDREAAVVARLHELAPHLGGEPDPAFRAATRARLVAMAAVRTPEPQPATGLRRIVSARGENPAPSRWRTRLTAGLAGAALTVTAAASLVGLAAGAGPGDVLYGLKRGTEQTQLALAGDARGRTLLELAGTRLDELGALVADGPVALPAAGAPGPASITLLAADADPELVISTLGTMDDQTTEGTAWLTDRAVATRDGAPLEELAGWLTQQTAGLTALQPDVPDAAGDAVSRSLALLVDVSARAEGLRSALDCAAGPAVDGTDALGPVPTACVAAPEPAAPGGGSTTAPPGTATGTGTGTGTDPQATTPAAPTVPPASGTGPGAGPTGSGSGSGAVPSVPGVPSLPLPTGGLPSLPLPPLPGTSAGDGPDGSGSGDGAPRPPAVDVPLEGPISVCLPPLATIGDC